MKAVRFKDVRVGDVVQQGEHTLRVRRHTRTPITTPTPGIPDSLVVLRGQDEQKDVLWAPPETPIVLLYRAEHETAEHLAARLDRILMDVAGQPICALEGEGKLAELRQALEDYEMSRGIS